MDFDTAVTLLLSPMVEGGYSRNPADPGKETMWGITAKTARANGYSGMMRLLPKTTAQSIYQKVYWAPQHIEQLPEALQYNFFDAGVNEGVEWANITLRGLLDLPTSPTAPDAQVILACSLANEYQISCLFLAERVKRYTSLPTWGAFGRGWANRLAFVLEVIGNPKGES